jgi:hypothetical protein
MQAQMMVRGRLRLQLFDKDGNLLDERFGNNLIPTVGKAYIAGLLSGAETVAPEYIALGTGSTAAAAGDTALETEITTGGAARQAASSSRTTTTVTNDTFQLSTTFTISDTFAITEAGILNAASAGTLIARRVFAAVNVVASNVLVATWTVAIS